MLKLVFRHHDVISKHTPLDLPDLVSHLNSTNLYMVPWDTQTDEIAQVKKGHVPEILGCVFSQEKMPLRDGPKPTTAWKTLLDISMSVDQRDHIILRGIFNNLVHFLRRI